MSDRLSNLAPAELEAIKARVREGLYSQLEKDLILSQISGAFTVEDAPETPIDSSRGNESWNR